MIQNTQHHITNPDSLYNPVPNGYSHIASVQAGSQLVFVARQGGEDNEGTFAPNFRKQVRQAFKNMEIALKAEQAEMEDIIKLTTLIVGYDATKPQVLIDESARFWPDKKFPPQTLIPVPQLALKEML